MSDQLKQRLIGAIVLVALGVIFIPMLLDNSYDARLSSRMEIPPKPAVLVTEKMENSINDELKKAQADIKPITKKIKKTIQSAVKPKPVKKPQVTASKPKSSQSNSEAKWIVQIGSFSDEANGLVLRDKLIASGFKAFSESAKGATGTVYRVRVGPVADRNTAENLRKSIQSKAKQVGIVMAYPSK